MFIPRLCPPPRRVGEREREREREGEIGLFASWLEEEEGLIGC